MKLTTKMRYGSRAMVDLALHATEGPIHSKDIACRQQFSVKYVEQLLSALQSAGLVRTVRGRGGGYALARPAAQITLRDIYEVLEGGDGFTDCTADPGLCARSGACPTRGVWARLYDSFISTLESITLESLAKPSQEECAAPPMYWI